MPLINVMTASQENLPAALKEFEAECLAHGITRGELESLSLKELQLRMNDLTKYPANEAKCAAGVFMRDCTSADGCYDCRCDQAFQAGVDWAKGKDETVKTTIRGSEIKQIIIDDPHPGDRELRGDGEC